MPPTLIPGNPAPISTHPACQNVTPDPEIPALSPWLATVVDIPGEVAAAQIDPRRLGRLAGHLLKERIGFWWPKERVRRRGPKGWREWDRSLFPGTLFFDVGRYDDRATLIEAQDYCRFHGWRLGLVRAGNGASQSVFRRQLASLEILLGADPTLSARKRIEPGRKVRVIAGTFMGAEGEMVEERGRAIFAVALNTLGRVGVEVEIARELVEAL